MRTKDLASRPQGRAPHGSAVPAQLLRTQLDRPQELPALLLGSPPWPGLTPAHAAAAWRGCRMRRRPRSTLLWRIRAGEAFKQSSRRTQIATRVQVAQASMGACSQWMPSDLFDAKKQSASSIFGKPQIEMYFFFRT